MKTLLVILASVLLVFSVVSIAWAAEGEPPQTASTSAEVSVNEFISITVDDATMDFGPVNPGTTGNVPSNDPLVITIGSETNINYQVTVISDAATFTGPGTLNDENLMWSTDQTTYTGYDNTSEAQVATGGPGGGSHNLYHRLDVPGGTTAGTYSLGITITAKNA